MDRRRFVMSLVRRARCPTCSTAVIGAAKFRARSLQLAADGDDRAAAQGAALQQLVTDRYQWSRIAAHTEDVYRLALARRRGGAASMVDDQRPQPVPFPATSLEVPLEEVS